MWIRGLFFIVFALFIDGMQAALAFAAFAVGAGLQTITPLGGAAAGAAACFAATQGAIAAVVAAGKCAVLGAGLSAFGIPVGIGLGMALEVCISLTFGFGLIFLLVMNDMYYPGPIFGNAFVEMIPGLDAIPSWTFMVIMCVLKKGAEEGQGALGVVTKLAASLATAETGVGAVVGGIGALNAAREAGQAPNSPINADITFPNQREPLNLKSPRVPITADIAPRRAANDNYQSQPYVQKAA